MLEALPRRAVLGRLAAFPLVGAAGAFVAIEPVDAAHTAIVARIGAAERRCAETKQAFETALAPYAESFPRPHWSIDYDNRDRSLCGRWVANCLRYAGGAKFLADKEGLEADYRDFWLANRDDPDACRTYARLTRRLKARVKRYKRQVTAHVQRHRLDELQRRCRDAEQDVLDLAENLFAQPTPALAVVRAQARAMNAYSRSSTARNKDWQLAIFGARLAANLDQLGAAA